MGDEIDEYELIRIYCEHDISRDLFNRMTWYNKINIALKIFYTLFKRDISGISEYYEQLTVKNTIRRMRTGIKFSLLFGLLEILGNCIFYIRCNRNDILLSALFITFCVVAYFWSFRLNQPNKCTYISVIILLSNLVSHLFIFSRGEKSILLTFVTDAILLVAHFIFLPLSIDIIFAVIVVYASTNKLYDWIVEEFVIYPNRTTGPLIVTSHYTTQMLIQILAWILFAFDGLRLHVWNYIRQLLGFLYLAQHIKLLKKYRTQTELQRFLWINLFPPSVSYKFKGIISQLDYRQYPEIRTSKVATIVCVDIVGFGELLAKSQLDTKIDILHQVYTTMDWLCEEMSCEKIAIMGNAYMAICKAEDYSPSNVFQSINFALCVCRVIKKMGKEYRRRLRARIGVHTGTVTIGIIGVHKPQYTIFSTDILVAKSLEETGIPGLVHISQNTYNQCKHIYRVAVGNKLTCEAPTHGPYTYTINTYYVDPQSSLHGHSQEFMPDRKTIYKNTLNLLNTMIEGLLDAHGDVLEINTHQRKITRVSHAPLVGMKSNGYPEKSVAAGFSVNTISQDNIQILVESLIGDIQAAPIELRESFMKPPIYYGYNTFFNEALEESYKKRIYDEDDTTILTSDSLIFLMDSVGLSVHCFIIVLITYLVALDINVKNVWNMANFFQVPILCLFNVFPVVLVTYQRTPTTQVWITRILDFFIKPRVCELYIIVFSLLPTLHTLVFFNFIVPRKNMLQAEGYLLLPFEVMACLTHALSTWSNTLSKIIGLIITITCFRLYEYTLTTSEDRKCFFHLTTTPRSHSRSQMMGVSILQILLITLTVFCIAQENDKIHRSMFYQKHELNEQVKVTRTAVHQTQNLLRDIIPEKIVNYITDAMINRTNAPIRIHDYWKLYSDVGVAFLSVSNFYKLYSNENGDKKLRLIELLHLLFCRFDDSFDDYLYQANEKIKAIGPTYLIMSDLFTIGREDSGYVYSRIASEAHLVALMEQCFTLLRIAKKFNDEFLEKYDRFQISIGFDCGSILMGMIGLTRPVFDIWGQPVNMAGKLMRNEIVDHVKVLENVTQTLAMKYDFIRAGTLKLEEEQIIYVCEKPED